MWRVILEGWPSDRELMQIVDAAMAEAARLSGAWLVCKPGCAECCIGPFPITAARRAPAARQGMRATRAARSASAPPACVSGRGGRRAPRRFPGDLTTGILDEDEEAEERFAALPDEEYCPALDPESLTCDLYEARPRDLPDLRSRRTQRRRRAGCVRIELPRRQRRADRGMPGRGGSLRSGRRTIGR